MSTIENDTISVADIYAKFEEERFPVSDSFEKIIEEFDARDGQQDGIITRKTIDEYVESEPGVTSLEDRQFESSYVASFLKNMLKTDASPLRFSMVNYGLAIKPRFILGAETNPDDSIPEGLQGNIKEFELAVGASINRTQTSNALDPVPVGIADLQLFYGGYGSGWRGDQQEDHVRFGILFNAEFSLYLNFYKLLFPGFGYDTPFYLKVGVGGSAQFALGDILNKKEVGFYLGARAYAVTGFYFNYFPKPGTGRWHSIGVSICIGEANWNNDSPNVFFSYDEVGEDQISHWGITADMRFALY